jgi:hypothetical protein
METETVSALITISKVKNFFLAYSTAQWILRKYFRFEEKS